MDIATTIECIAVLIVGAYLVGLAVVWVCEIKRNALYQKMQNKIRGIEDGKIMMAVFHARTYGIMENYRQRVLEIEKTRDFVLERVLFIKRKNRRNIDRIDMNRTLTIGG